MAGVPQRGRGSENPGDDSRPLSRDPYPETLTLPITAPTVAPMRTLFEALAAGSLTALLWLVS
jgi:hypothetical protein